MSCYADDDDVSPFFLRFLNIFFYLRIPYTQGGNVLAGLALFPAHILSFIHSLFPSYIHAFIHCFRLTFSDDLVFWNSTDDS
jgi:hypothetical protein